MFEANCDRTELCPSTGVMAFGLLPALSGVRWLISRLKLLGNWSWNYVAQLIAFSSVLLLNLDSKKKVLLKLCEHSSRP